MASAKTKNTGTCTHGARAPRSTTRGRCSPEPDGRRDVERREQFRVRTLEQHRDCFLFHRARIVHRQHAWRPAVHCRLCAAASPRAPPRSPRSTPRPVTSRPER